MLWLAIARSTSLQREWPPSCRRSVRFRSTALVLMMLDVTMTLEFARWGDLFERFFRVEIEELCFLRPARRPFTSLKPIGHLGLLRLRPHRFPCPKLLSLSVQTVVKWSFFFFDGIRNLLKKVQSQLSANRCGRQETRKVRAMKLTVNGQERVLEGA